MTRHRPLKWHGLRTTIGSSLATALSAVPPFLIGGLAPTLREDIDLDTGRLGVLVAIYFLAGAVAAVPGGRLAERLGPRRGLLATGSVTSLSLAFIGLAVHNWPELAVVMVVAGFSNGMVHPASNLAIMRGVTVARRGAAFGIKQAAAPLATMFAGLALPVFALTLGWRMTFLMATMLLPLVALTLPSGLADVERNRKQVPRLTDPTLVLTAVASALGFGGATTVGAFLVDSVVSAGGEPTTAALTLTAASAACIAVRLTIGWRTDRVTSPSIGVVAGLMVVGAAGLLLLALPGPDMWRLGAVIGMAAGWGWPGLLYHAVATFHPRAPAAATAVATTGNALGAAIAPLFFGLIASRFSFETAWTASATALAVAAALMVAADRRRRRFISAT